MKILKKALALLLMLAMVATVTALVACKDDPPVDPTPDGPVEKQLYLITVKDNEGGLVTGATLSIYKGTTLVTTLTTANGLAKAELEAVDYAVVVSCTGYTAEASYPLLASAPSPTITLTKADTGLTYSITLSDSNGPLAGIAVQLCVENGGCIAPQVTDAEGKLSIKVAASFLETGKRVYLSFPNDYERLAEDYLVEEKYFFEEGSTEMDLTLPARPDGSQENPFKFAGSTVTVTLPAGGTYYYHAFGIHGCIFDATGFTGGKLVLDADKKYGSTSYEAAADGTLHCILPTSDISGNVPVVFTLTNTGDADITVTFDIKTLPGTSENPYIIESILAPLTVTLPSKDSGLYYEWIATVGGTLTITCENTNSSITLNNLTASKYETPTNGAATTSVAVTAGDRIQIIVNRSATAGEDAELTFTLTMTVG